MARRKQRRTGRRTAQPQVVHPEAAGLDVGATAVYAAVRTDRASPAIRNFPTFTVDLHALADWLQESQVTTVAMESTGVYWIPVFQILEARGFEVVLVNARLVRSAPGRKSDVADCEWLRHLHSAGLLRGSFRPPDEVCALRTLLRHRDTLVKAAARSVLHMQKSYDQMNIHVHHAISDLTGVTGMAITDAILAGERDPARLAALADRRIKASRDTLIKALNICSPCSKRGRPMRTTSNSSTPVISRSRPRSAPCRDRRRNPPTLPRPAPVVPARQPAKVSRPAPRARLNLNRSSCACTLRGCLAPT